MLRGLTLTIAIFTDPCKFISSPIEEAKSLFFFSQEILIWFLNIIIAVSAIVTSRAGIRTQQEKNN